MFFYGFFTDFLYEQDVKNISPNKTVIHIKTDTITQKALENYNEITQFNLSLIKPVK